MVELDLNKTLEEQPPCNVYIHKLTDIMTAVKTTDASAGSVGENTHGEQIGMSPAELAVRLRQWQSYLAKHGHQIADLDPITAQQSSTDRVAFLAILEQMNHALPEGKEEFF